MVKKFLCQLTVIVSAAANCACSIPFMDNTKMNRTGYVIKIHDSNNLERGSIRCLKQISPQEIVSRRYVEIRRLIGRQTNLFTAELTDQVDVKVGDRVALSSGACTSNSVPKVERVVSRAD